MQLVRQFIRFKRQHGADAPFGTVDKTSGVNRRGEIIKAFADNRIWHAHLSEAGDPLIVYKKVAPNHIIVIRVSTHKEHFVGNRSRSQFVALDPEFYGASKRRKR